MTSNKDEIHIQLGIGDYCIFFNKKCFIFCRKYQSNVLLVYYRCAIARDLVLKPLKSGIKKEIVFSKPALVIYLFKLSYYNSYKHLRI